MHGSIVPTAFDLSSTLTAAHCHAPCHPLGCSCPSEHPHLCQHISSSSVQQAACCWGAEDLLLHLQAFLHACSAGGAGARVARSTDVMAHVLQTLFGEASVGHQGLLVTQGAQQAAQQGPGGPCGLAKAAAMQGMSQMALLRVAAAEYPGTVLAVLRCASSCTGQGCGLNTARLAHELRSCQAVCAADGNYCGRPHLHHGASRTGVVCPVPRSVVCICRCQVVQHRQQPLRPRQHSRVSPS